VGGGTVPSQKYNPFHSQNGHERRSSWRLGKGVGGMG
jgi:hypothetical protein